jgi:hypothetical protein
MLTYADVCAGTSQHVTGKGAEKSTVTLSYRVLPAASNSKEEKTLMSASNSMKEERNAGS